MKNIILIFTVILITSFSFSQDTSYTSLKEVNNNSLNYGKYKYATNRVSVTVGRTVIEAGGLQIPLSYMINVNEIDTNYLPKLETDNSSFYYNKYQYVTNSSPFVFGNDTLPINSLLIPIVYIINPNESSVTNLYNYAHKDSLNSFSMLQTMDSILVTRHAVLDTIINNVEIGNTGTKYILSKTENNLIIGRENLTSSIVIGGSGSSDIINFTIGNITAFSLTPSLVTVDRSLQLKSYTTTQRDALTPTGNWIIYNTTLSKFQGWNGSTWVDFN